VDQVNDPLRSAAQEGPLKGILGLVERPLVFDRPEPTNTHSWLWPLIRVGQSGTQLRVLAWYRQRMGVLEPYARTPRASCEKPSERY